MRADLIHTVALALRLNDYLNFGSERAPEFLGSSVFRGVIELTFERGGDTLMKGKVAEGSAPWMKRMERESVFNARLLLEGCPVDPKAPIVNPWGMLTDGDIGLELWSPQWRPRVMHFGEATYARVNYLSNRSTRFFLKPPLELDKAVASMESTVEKVRGVLSAESAIAEGLDNAFVASDQFNDLLFEGNLDTLQKKSIVRGLALADAFGCAQGQTSPARRAQPDAWDQLLNATWQTIMRTLESAVHEHWLMNMKPAA